MNKRKKLQIPERVSTLDPTVSFLHDMGWVAPLPCHQWLLGQVTRDKDSHSCTTSWARLLPLFAGQLTQYSVLIFFTRERGNWVQSRSEDLQTRSVSTAACCVTLGHSLPFSDANRALHETVLTGLGLQLKPFSSCDSQLRFASLLNSSGLSGPRLLLAAAARQRESICSLGK